MQPKMQRHHENYAHIELCNKLDAEITDALSKEDQEHMVSMSVPDSSGFTVPPWMASLPLKKKIAGVSLPHGHSETTGIHTR